MQWGRREDQLRSLYSLIGQHTHMGLFPSSAFKLNVIKEYNINVDFSFFIVMRVHRYHPSLNLPLLNPLTRLPSKRRQRANKILRREKYQHLKLIF